jgi:hypothetical protein
MDALLFKTEQVSPNQNPPNGLGLSQSDPLLYHLLICLDDLIHQAHMDWGVSRDIQIRTWKPSLYREVLEAQHSGWFRLHDVVSVDVRQHLGQIGREAIATTASCIPDSVDGGAWVWKDLL